jgi:hypothetical protein
VSAIRVMAKANTASLNDITCSTFMSGVNVRALILYQTFQLSPLYQLLPILLSFIRKKAE